ncbi:MAG: discoidin domain-containing protein [Pirellulaceae bacterium]|nr:discoidin domain-containing protein [Pirellulaceae bacterium]
MTFYKKHLLYRAICGVVARESIARCLLALLLGLLSSSVLLAERYQLDLAEGDRVWIGPEFWANRLHDWQVSAERIECIASAPRLRHRTLTLLTHEVLAGNSGSLEIQLRLGLINEDRQAVSPEAAAGILLGIGQGGDYRSRALIHGAAGPGAGYFVGLNTAGRLVAYDLANPIAQNRAFAPPEALPRGNWKVVSVDSDEGGNTSQAVLDGNPNTIWHTQWLTVKDPYPHQIVIDMGQVESIDGFAMLPRQGQAAGRIKEYQIFLATERDQWGEPVATGQFQDNQNLQRVAFARTRARYLKLAATSAFNDRPSATVAEIFALDSQRAQPSQAAEPQESFGDLEDATLKLSLREFADQDAVFDVRLSQGPRTIETVLRIPQDRIAGGIALGAHPGSTTGKSTTGQFWFRDLELSGELLKEHPERAVGPILSTMYTISDKTLKLTAQMFPISDTAPCQVGLQRQTGDGTWMTIDVREIVVPGWTVPFRVDSWDDSQAAHLRVIYPVDNPTTEYHCWTTANPVDQEEVVFAGFTGNHMVGRGFESDGYDFATNIWFPHQVVVDAVAFHRPDVLFFSGDQVYEGGSPTFADANPENIKLDYLYKWYLWCWSYRELTRRIPTICIPDDHDVYQGNLWGQGGRKSPGRDHDGGYVHPADFVQMVERTQTSHLPDPYWTQPLEQGITAYYTDFTWGEIGIAVLEDRKFKSGCNRPDMPPSGSGRPDHFNDPEFEVARLDLPGLKLLGDEQLAFLDAFVRDWRDQKMKIAVSQTIFANMATHHGGGMQRLIADLDSNGWPQSGRNRAMDRLRKGFVFHLAGDQHLATIVHHGIEEHGDAIWSFCVPSVANFYPRAWAPKQPGEYSWPEPEDYTGTHRDGFKHPVTVYAATNPGRSMGQQPALLHDGMPGYGIVRMNKSQRTITMECWPRFADPSQADAKQYLGWPKTIRQFDNYARQPIGYLADLQVRGGTDPVVTVTNERTGELVLAVRIQGQRYRVPAYDDANHTVSVQHGEQVRVFQNRTPQAEPATMVVEF